MMHNLKPKNECLCQTPRYFCLTARILHWSMAVLILAMLFIGIGMVSTVTAAHRWLLEIHEPLGLLILVLALVRLAIRILNPPPPLPADLPGWQRFAAHASHWLLYALMLAIPLIGWAMLSAEGFPIAIAHSLYLPALMRPNAVAYAVLRTAHTYLALLLFLTVIVHVGAALYHGLVRRDGVFSSMSGVGSGRRGSDQDPAQSHRIAH